MKNDISKVKVSMSMSKLELKKKNLELDNRQFLKTNGIEDLFKTSCQNMDLFKELGIEVPISYMDIPVEMEDYRKYYDKFIHIVNEYIHNIEQNKKDKIR